ncbi:Similar to Uncharacterized protein YPR153W; acc. no. Q06537 [Pyronema omphalodes CBS 100304]|uniref:Similar to Uncharacterized protein YPR153W acc. no. Q06537 n=1 Tax=Pyronema omphalodes (strain CBS 100304) TaxID=1076935 RepID=U4KV64_PYROM|nr:Similar to Uncharacterized protein YPR153W; acc. no. Q06537 [Pyronema omphalodes CBS 100304]
MTNGPSLSNPPLGYTAPPFPSLYWPIKPLPGTSVYLYETDDIWRFTLYWSLILFAGFHLASGIYAFCMMPSKMSLGIPIVFAIVGGMQATMAGSLVGVIIGAVFKAGHFRMSTWIPLVWGTINVLVLVLSSFSLQGGL